MRERGIWKRFYGNKILVLAGILLLIPIMLWLQSGPSAHPKTQTLSRKDKAAITPADTEDLVSLVPKLSEPRPEFIEEKRNIFGFHEPPPPPPVVARQPEEDTEAAENDPPPAVCGNQACEEGESSQNCPTDCGPPPPPEISLRYIGYLAEKKGQVAFLTDGKEVFMGRVNDIIANKYRILKISDESVELGYLNLDQSRSIPFQGSGKS